MATSDIITAFESGDFDLEDRTSMYLAPFYRVCVDQGRITLKCCPITSRKKFLRAPNKNFFDSSTMNERNYSPKTASTDER